MNSEEIQKLGPDGVERVNALLAYARGGPDGIYVICISRQLASQIGISQEEMRNLTVIDLREALKSYGKSCPELEQ